MEFFIKSKAVRLKSHLNKYLIADDDQTSTRQSRHGDSRRARWLVELVDTNPHVLRLKSCHNRYLATSKEAFQFGMIGRKVLQTLPENDLTIEWQPIRDGFQVKLKSFQGTYLRANGATPPWRNSVTHNSPNRATLQDWIVWDVEAVDVPEDEALDDYLSMVSNFSSITDAISGLEIGNGFGSLVRKVSCRASPFPRWLFMKKVQKIVRSPLVSLSRITAMDLFRSAKSIRLKSCHGKFLVANDNQESVTQDRNGSSISARWFVEFVENSNTIIRLKSCYGKYLTASNQPFLLKTTGSKVLQTLPTRLDSSLEWEPVRENGAIKLKTRYGHFLRANGGLAPWKNSVTHDIPHRMATKGWIVWEVQVLEILEDSSTSDSTNSSKSTSFSEPEDDCLVSWTPKTSEGRLIYFHIWDEYGEVDDQFEEICIAFKGTEVNELTKRLEMETGLHRITVCTLSPSDRKLYPLRLQLPPNNATMHVVVVPNSFKIDI